MSEHAGNPKPNLDEAITDLLNEWSSSDDKKIAQRLFEALYHELRRISRNKLKQEHHGHTWDSSDLVNEAFLRLANQKSVLWENRDHFLGIAARLMRQLLVEHQRKKSTGKRNWRLLVKDFEPQALENLSDNVPIEIVKLDEGLKELEKHWPRKARLVELRYIIGLSIDDSARVLKVSLSTAKRDWAFAKAWLTDYFQRTS